MVGSRLELAQAATDLAGVARTREALEEVLGGEQGALAATTANPRLLTARAAAVREALPALAELLMGDGDRAAGSARALRAVAVNPWLMGVRMEAALAAKRALQDRVGFPPDTLGNASKRFPRWSWGRRRMKVGCVQVWYLVWMGISGGMRFERFF